MPHGNHVAIWVDHLQARIFYIGLAEVESQVLHSHLSTQHLHHKANTIGSGHAAGDRDFLASIEKAVDGSEQLLILGPSTEKAALKGYLEERPNASKRTISVEAADHLTDNEIIALAKRHFGLDPVRHIS